MKAGGRCADGVRRYGGRFGRHRGSLHRRLFLWFGVSIVVTGFVTFSVVSAVGPGHSFVDEVFHVRAFAEERFGAVWRDARARRELARSVARNFGVGVVLRDEAGTVLSREGACDRSNFDVPISEDGRAAGTVSICVPKRRGGGRGVFFVALGVASLTLWALSMVIARRLGRPLQELARVASEVGSGRLARRVALGRHQPGEVGALADAIDDMAVRIEKQLSDQRELLAAVSHEIRGPLARLRVLVELLRGKGVDETSLAKFEREIVEIDSLVGDLLASSRLEFSLLKWTPLDAFAVAGEALERAGVSADRLVEKTSDPTFDGDPTLVARALANLLDNAEKHAGGATELAVTDGDGVLVFDVRDSGRGFPEDILPRAFEAFQAGRIERRGATSLGLGLALVRRIAEAHGGTAWAENLPAGGASVKMSVRRHHPSVPS